MPSLPLRFPASTYDQIMYLGRKGSDQQARCVISFAGRINAERMARAVRLTVDAEPVLGYRFVVHPWRPYWERRDDLDHIELLSVVKGAHVEDELWRFVTMPLDPFADPQVQTSIFRSDRDTLCIKLNHVAADGEGVKQYAYLLATTYRKLTTDPSYRPELYLEGMLCQSNAFGGTGFLKSIIALRRCIMPRPAWGFPLTGNDLSDRSFEIRRIRPERFRIIKEYGRRQQASVNDIVLAAFYRALFKIIDPPKGVSLCVSVPIDLRRYLPPSKAPTVCNLLCCLYPTITREYRETFEHTLGRIHEAMAAIKSTEPGVGTSLYQKLIFKLGFERVQYITDRITGWMVRTGKANPCLSNVGIINEQQLDFGDVEVADAFVLSPVEYPPHFMLAFSTFRETITFTSGFCNATTQRPVIGRFFNLFESELPG